MINEIEIKQCVRTERSEEEIDNAHQVLSDAFHPRKVYQNYHLPDEEWEPYACESCGETEFHATTCHHGKSRFQGWSTNVSKYKHPGGQCQQDGCYKYAIKRIRLNIWGCLCEYDVCDEHAVFKDGRSKDLIMCDGL